jgi:glycosyltransferase involved in cell wall biosynthesis
MSAPVSTPSLAGTRIFAVILNIPYWGSERMAVQTLMAARDAGADVLVAACDWEMGGIRTALDAAGIAHVDVPVRGRLSARGTPWYLAQQWWRGLETGRALRRAAHAFGPTHIFIPDEGNLLFSIPLLVGRRATSVFSLPTPPDNARPRLRQVYERFWRWLVSPLSDVLVVNSEYTGNQLRQMLPGRSDARVVYYCVPERAARPDPALDLVRRDRFNIVYVGQMAAHKGVQILVDAARTVVARHADVDVVLAGSWKREDGFAVALRESVRAAGLDDRIRFLGEVQDVPGLLSRCAVHVMPSLWEEPFGIVVIEAKQAGIPSVVFRGGAWAELVRHQVDGYACTQRTAAALVEAFEYFIQDPRARHDAAQAARASAQRFSRERFATGWVDVFRGVRR